MIVNVRIRLSYCAKGAEELKKQLVNKSKIDKEVVKSI
jgi:hypothetical protein